MAGGQSWKVLIDNDRDSDGGRETMGARAGKGTQDRLTHGLHMG